MNYRTIGWVSPQHLARVSYVCGYCDHKVSPDKGYGTHQNDDPTLIAICPYCAQPTFLPKGGKQIPGSLFGGKVGHLPSGVHDLYEEARKCHAQSAYTSSVMACRKILMNIAVEKGAKENLSFVEYVNYLYDKGIIAKGSKDWVDHIREKGNEANHEIKIMSKEDAERLIQFIEIMLKQIYEFPARLNTGAQTAGENTTP